MPRSVLRVVFLIVFALTACAPRAVPQTFPTRSALSVHAACARSYDVIRALREDPPLPGDEAAGWPGLLDAQEPEAHHAR